MKQITAITIVSSIVLLNSSPAAQANPMNPMGGSEAQMGQRFGRFMEAFMSEVERPKGERPRSSSDTGYRSYSSDTGSDRYGQRASEYGRNAYSSDGRAEYGRNAYSSDGRAEYGRNAYSSDGRAEYGRNAYSSDGRAEYGREFPPGQSGYRYGEERPYGQSDYRRGPYERRAPVQPLFRNTYDPWGAYHGAPPLMGYDPWGHWQGQRYLDSFPGRSGYSSPSFGAEFQFDFDLTPFGSGDRYVPDAPYPQRERRSWEPPYNPGLDYPDYPSRPPRDGYRW